MAILLLASALRFCRLDAQSFWNDEGNSARIAERSLRLIIEGTASDIHPPLYYLLLHYWRALFGASEFALRSLSVVAGVALVAFTYLLGRHLFGEPTGLVAAFLGAISPFAIYYSQEARMYALLAALSAGCTYVLLRLLSDDVAVTKTSSRTIWSMIYVLTGAAGLYTHYAFAFVLLVHNAIFGLRWLAGARRSARLWRRWARWAGLQAAVAALYLPWFPIAFRSVTGWSSAGRPFAPGPALLDVLRILSVGITLPLEEAGAALAGAGVLLLVGLWPGPRSLERPRTANHPAWFGVASVALYLSFPIGFIFAFDLYKPAWLKFLLVVQAPFHVLLAHGVENLARVAGSRGRGGGRSFRPASYLLCAVLAALALYAVYPSLDNLYFDPAYARDDYRQIAADVAALGRPGDAVILNAPNQWEVFTYYYPDQDVYPAPYGADMAAVEAFLSPLIERYGRLFVIYWGDAESDPRRRIETWLATHAYKAHDRWYGRVRLAIYGAARRPQEPAVALDGCFGEAIELRGYALEGAAFGPGDVLPVTLFWEAASPVSERYKVTVQLLDDAGHLAAQHDTEPGDGLAPTSSWQPGTVLVDRYGVLIPDDLPTGRYSLVVAMYHVAGGERLPVRVADEPVGDHLSLDTVAVDSLEQPGFRSRHVRAAGRVAREVR